MKRVGSELVIIHSSGEVCSTNSRDEKQESKIRGIPAYSSEADRLREEGKNLTRQKADEVERKRGFGLARKGAFGGGVLREDQVVFVHADLDRFTFVEGTL